VRLRQLEIRALPGIRPGFRLSDIAPGLNVVVGPNASGKTSLCRALRALLYPEEARGVPVHLEADVEVGGSAARIVRVGGDPRWLRDGVPVERPPLPEHRFVDCFTIQVDALVAAGETERRIGARIARELSGGYDLRAVRDAPPFRLKANHGRPEARALREAERDLAQRQREHAGLHEQEQRLAALERERDEAEQAARDADACRRAAALLECRRRRGDCERVLAEYPDGMERLRGGEPARLESLREARRELEAELAEARRAQDGARAALAASGLADSALDGPALDEQRAHAARLREAERAIAQHLDDERACAERLATAAAALGAPEPGRAPSLAPETLARVEEALGEKRALEAELGALDAELSRLSAAEGGSEAATDPERVRAARRELLRWLAAPAPPRAPWPRRIALALAALAALALAGVAAAASPAWLVVALLLPLLAALAWVAWPAGGGAARRRAAAEEFHRSGVAAPSGWDEPAVRARLDELDREVQAAERRALERQRADETRRRRTEAVERHGRCVAALEEVAREVGFDPGRLDASFDRWLKLVAALDAAGAERATAQARLDGAREDAAARRRRLRDFLAAHGEPVADEVADAEALAAALERLGRRLRARDEARRGEERAAEAAARCRRDLDRRAAEEAEVYTDAGLEPGAEAALRERVARREDWQRAREALAAARHDERRAQEALGDAAALRRRVEAGDDARLAREAARLDAAAARRDALLQEITAIQTRIDAARKGRALEDARAARQAAEDALGERLDEALFAEAGHCLLEQVESEHVAESRPQVLARAREWFRRFTRNQFELELAAGGDEGFAALDAAAGERRSVAELSTGTRMQLLLAVRLAFALEAEKGRTALPLFLDEALTTADPERFRAVVESVRVLASEQDRQVFYLTAQPRDALAWSADGEAPHVIDMARLRGAEAAVGAAEELAPAPAPAPPAPDGASAAAYGARLAVPRIDPWAPPTGIHVFHLLRDDLALLHRLLLAGATRVGRLETLLAAPGAAALLDAGERERLAARAALAHAFVRAWRRGRGRPLGPADVAGSPVTETFRDQIAALAEACGGDARAVLAAIDERRVKGFRRSKRDELESWLEAQGFLDLRPECDDLEIELEVLDALAPHLETGALTAPEVRQRLRELRAGL